jgi:hypothetical protein
MLTYNCTNFTALVISGEGLTSIGFIQRHPGVLIKMLTYNCTNFTALVISGEGLTSIWFIQRHPGVLIKMLNFGIASALGQVSSYLPEIFH